MEKMELEERFEASLTLAGVGDALGYKNGKYEFCRSGPSIHQDLESEGGLGSLHVNPSDWRVSDDTIMTIATGEALVSDWTEPRSLYTALADQYVQCMKLMGGRAPGTTTLKSTSILARKTVQDGVISFNPRGGGCGAAMRSAPIGLVYHRPDQIQELVSVAIESGRLTHNHPTGYLGSLATALFVSYAVQQKPLIEWGAGLIDTLDSAWRYIESSGRNLEQNRQHWPYFSQQWTAYLRGRGIKDGKSQPWFPDQYGPAERDAFYKSVSYSGIGGASGHDAPMIAYDALLGCGDSWTELCRRGMFHGGDSDSTGIIAGACWGAMSGFSTVPEAHYRLLEYRDKLVAMARKCLEKNKLLVVTV